MTLSIEPGSRQDSRFVSEGALGQAIASGPSLVAPTPIIGRDGDVRHLVQMLRRGSRLVTLTGTAGVGKTRLAEEVACEAGQAGLFRHGVQFVRLQNIRDAGLVIPMIGSSLGIDPTDTGDVLARLVAEMGERQALLVVDNVEQVIDAAPALGHLVASCPGLALLVTSRRSLNLRAEQVFAVTPLSLPASVSEASLTEIEASPAVQAFTQFAQARMATFGLDAGNAPVVASICSALDGLPLALELAAARIDVLSLASLVEQVKSRADILIDGPVDVPDRHRGMHVAIAWSYDLLDPARQRWFRRLSVLEGSFDLAMASHVCDTAEDGEAAALETLSNLVRASLVVAEPASDHAGTRFRMLETIRSYGRSLLSTTEADDVRRRYISFMQADLKNAAPGQYREIEGNEAGLHAALSWAWDAGNAGLVLDLVTSLEAFWRRRSRMDVGMRWLDRSLTLTEDDRLQSRRLPVLLAASTMARLLGDFPRAEKLGREALDHARRAGDEASQARALNALGAIATQQGDYEQAGRLCRRAHELYQRLGDESGEAVALHNLALASLGQSHLSSAMRMLEQALAIAQEAGPCLPRSALLHSLGACRLALGRLDAATRLFREALSESEQEGDPVRIAICHIMLVGISIERDDPGGASAHADKALSHARRTGQPLPLIGALTCKADTLIRWGSLDEAESLLSKAWDEAQTFGVPVARQLVLRFMGDLRHARGQFDSAFELYEESLEYWLPGGDLFELVPLLVPAADAASRIGQEDTARQMLGVVTLLQTAGLVVPASCRDMHRRLCGTLRHTFTPSASEAGAFSGQRIRQALENILLRHETPDPLSDRERTVLALLAAGQTNTQMAEQLFLSPHTINTHVRRIYEKIGVNSRSAATRYAVERGVLQDVG